MEHDGKELGWWKSEWLPLSLVLLLSAAFFLSFFNRFAGLRSGDGEFGGGVAFLAGLRPYRDYFTAGPPLNIFKSVLALSIFGKLLIVSRALAVCERLLIAGTLYYWLRRLFSQPASALGALVAIVVSAGDHTDPLASYNHDAIFLAMLCGLLAGQTLSLMPVRRYIAFASLAGVCGGLSLLTKQTVGGCVLLVVLLYALIAQGRLHGMKRAVLWVGCFFSGAFVPVAVTAMYLWHLGALNACLQMMFVSGPHAKASNPLMFLAREVMIAGLYRWWLALAVLCLVCAWRPLLGGVRRGAIFTKASRRTWLVAGAVFASVFLVAAMGARHVSTSLTNTGKASVYFVLLGTVIVGLASLQETLLAPESERQRAFGIFLLATVSFGIAVSLSLSFPAFEAMSLPGLGLLIALAYDGAGLKGKTIVLAAATVAVFFQVAEKLAIPFEFDHQQEARVHAAILKSSDPMLRGMRLPASTARFIDGVGAVVRERVRFGDTIFTYPEFGLLYTLNGRYPPTRTASHNIDVVEDSFARAESQRLLQAPPAVIIYAKPSEDDLRVAEVVWRGGKKSGQRDIVNAVDQIVAKYELMGTYQLMPQDTPIRIYARPVTGVPASISVK